jgi:hypothetical protein
LMKEIDDIFKYMIILIVWEWLGYFWNLIVVTPEYPSGIPDMHTIHDPMISVSWIHISELITELHHPLQYRIMLTIGHMTKYDIDTQGKSTTKQRIPSSVDDPCHAYYPTGNWLGDVPSSHRRRGSHCHLLSSLLQNLAKLIARDKAVSTFWNCTRKLSKREHSNAIWL